MAYLHHKSMITHILHLIVIIFMYSICSLAEFQKFEHPAKGDGSLSFLVIGDWGRRGLDNQSEVASQMGRIGDKLDIDFVVSTGDNFYDDGLKGINDPTFKESFTRVYTAKSLRKKWYSVLGNHDYRGDVKAQISHVLRNIDSRWLCLRSFVLNAEIADFFFVDTSPFVDMYFNATDHTYDWRGVLPRRTYLANLLKDLESALKASTARWKFVVGHHAIKSIGHHGDTPELINQLLPMLQANGVDLYMNGHDHCLEHMSNADSAIQFLTSGAGSKAWRGNVKRDNEINGVKFFYDGSGFMSVQLTQTDCEIAFYNVLGKTLYRWKVSKQLHSVM